MKGSQMAAYGCASGSTLHIHPIGAPATVAEAVVEGIRAEDFLILPHPEVAEYARRKGDDRERWLRGMRRLRANAEAAGTRAEG